MTVTLQPEGYLSALEIFSENKRAFSGNMLVMLRDCPTGEVLLQTKMRDLLCRYPLEHNEKLLCLYVPLSAQAEGNDFGMLRAGRVSFTLAANRKNKCKFLVHFIKWCSREKRYVIPAVLYA